MAEKEEYDFKKIEEKWQKEWEKAGCFQVKEDSKKKKYYVLEMYPYPSASFLHMGHVRNYTIGDVYARFRRMQGWNVLYPMGYDSFGLPAETAAKKEGIHPKKYTEAAIKKIMEYQKALGNSYDWTRTLASHEPDYYKWNQYFFLKLLEKKLAYRKKAPVNWCNKCESVLANEEAENGKCWRCGEEVVQKDLEQWFFKITDYADRLLEDLDKIQWPEKIKTMQRNWIDRSEGINFKEKVKGLNLEFEVYDSVPQTFIAQTFTVIAPEHPLVKKLVEGTKYEKPVMEFVEKIKKKKLSGEFNIGTDIEGIFTGRHVDNPFGVGDLPIWVASYVLAEYGTGIVNCSAHDERDFIFAKKYGVPLKIAMLPKDKAFAEKVKNLEVCYHHDSQGIIQEPKEFRGMSWGESRAQIMDYIEKKKFGKRAVHYKIRDWMISRQRYWGTPIPVIYCDKCGIVPVHEKDLPVLLPEKVDFKTNGNPLATSKEFVNAKCPNCKGKARRETDTMGGFVDSSWYFLRYCDNKNSKKAFDEKKVNYWMPVDQYIGGAEHAVMHLIYARFFVKALKDFGIVKFDEPFSKLFNQGIVYKDGAKMSKSKGNVVFQTDISNKYGIDTARLFLMFVSSPDQQMEWSDEGIEGSFRIINRLINLRKKVVKEISEREEHKINSTIKKVTGNIESFEYPKAIVSIIGFLNSIDKISKKNYENLLKLISPFCPHIAEEIWHKLGNKSFISLEKWPEADESKIDEKFEQEEQAQDKLVEDIKNIIKILEAKGQTNMKEIKIFAIPKEIELYNQAKEKLEKVFGMEVSVLSIQEAGKTGKKIKAVPGKPGILIE
ncbi:MAG: leucine--tRNA ligase [Candidatus Pacearchaeota archaeon]|nr:leucine--tRNA ligase [Candidatus Pacearchaeota archaeon]